MLDVFLITFFVAGFIGLRRLWLAALLGAVLAPAVYAFSDPLNLMLALALAVFGCLSALLGRFAMGWFFSGYRGGRRRTGPVFMGGFGGGRGGAPPGGIVLSDEERRP